MFYSCQGNRIKKNCVIARHVTFLLISRCFGYHNYSLFSGICSCSGQLLNAETILPWFLDANVCLRLLNVYVTNSTAPRSTRTTYAQLTKKFAAFQGNGNLKSLCSLQITTGPNPMPVNTANIVTYFVPS